ncbi:alcohol dehydrogenase, partial [Streptomyces sp. 8K308]|uniref:zinc-binding dehydrogenase n=1 Tax=Streptomyces sp. 8K308 TaxID=2530388 RepID=UPI00104EAFB6
PVPAPHQALIAVESFSLNFGELDLLHGEQPGAVLGRDSAGVVVRPASDGSGPAAGARVAAFGLGGGWAELRAVDPAELAVLPDAVDLGTAATLPAAGVSALRAVRRLGSLLGRRVLVTGASGGVGRFAVQLAALSGAHVIASVGTRARGAGLRDLGAAEVVVGLDEVTEPVHAALDNVGGPLLAQALDLVAEHGAVIQIGAASNQPTTLTLAHKLVNKRLDLFVVGEGLTTTPNGVWNFGPDIALLAELVAAHRLTPHIGWRGPWHRAPEAVEALRSRRVAGKAVLDIT